MGQKLAKIKIKESTDHFSSKDHPMEVNCTPFAFTDGGQ
jgi:hypothetical protein